MDNLPTINVAYSKILVLDRDGNYMYPGSNIPDYDIHPWHTFDFINIDLVQEQLGITFPYRLDENTPVEVAEVLNRLGSQKFEDFLDNTDGNFRIGTVDQFLETGENFIYPIMLYTSNLWHDHETAHIDPRVIRQAQLGKAKIVFAQFTEGFFGQRDYDYYWMSKFAQTNNLKKENIWMISSNLGCSETLRDMAVSGTLPDNFTAYPYNYFQHNLWFMRGGRLRNPNVRHDVTYLGTEGLRSNRNKIIDKHFLCFNRVSKYHRLILFGELMTNPLLKDKSIVTCGPSTVNLTFYEIANTLSEEYGLGKERIVDFFKNYDDEKAYIFDEPDLHNNKASSLNIEAHNKTFVNIVTESAIDSKTVFFSEKIYKPIACSQPFIIAGNPHSLKKLQELGFQTFNKWWDESYDEEEDPEKRVKKIVSVLEKIASWPIEKCRDILVEMEDVLQNNSTNLISLEPMDRVLKDLGKFEIS